MDKVPIMVEYDKIEPSAERYRLYYESLKTEGKIPKTIVPYEVEIQLTNACNLRCRMCEVWSWHDKNKDKQTTLTTETLKRLFKEFSDMGIRSVLLTGGEPLLRKDFKELVDYADSLGLKGALQTNGVLLNKDIAKFLLKRGWNISVSFDSPKKETYENIRGVNGSFDVVYKNIMDAAKLSKKYEGQFRVPMVIQQDNSGQIIDFVDLMEKIGVDNCSTNFICCLTPMFFGELDYYNIRKLSEDFIKGDIKNKKFFELAKIMFWPWMKSILSGDITKSDLLETAPLKSLIKNKPVTCFASDFVMINAFGEVYPCCYQFNVAQKKQGVCVGNIHEKSFKEIWFGGKFNSARKELLEVDLNKPICCNCQWCERYFNFKQIEKIALGKRGSVRKIKKRSIIDISKLSNKQIADLIKYNHQIYNGTLIFENYEKKSKKEIQLLSRYAKKIGFDNVYLRKEDDLDRIKKWASGKQPGPIRLTIYPTDKCNLNCVYCWKQDHEGAKIELSDERWLRLVDEAKVLGVKEWVIEGGGEPLCRKDLLMKLVKKIREKGMNGEIVTNGTLLDKETMAVLVGNRWDTLTISIDSADEMIEDLVKGKGVFVKQLSALRLINKIKKEQKRPKVNLQAVLTKYNKEKLQELFDFAEQNNINHIDLLKLSPDNKNTENMKTELGDIGIKTKISNNIDNFKLKAPNCCFEPYLQLTINAAGNVGVCCMSDYGLGNIRDIDLNEIWDDERLKIMRKNMLKGQMKDYCKNCDVSFVKRTSSLMKMVDIDALK